MFQPAAILFEIMVQWLRCDFVWPQVIAVEGGHVRWESGSNRVVQTDDDGDIPVEVRSTRGTQAWGAEYSIFYRVRDRLNMHSSSFKCA